jgi:MoaA/NifB/PqqE/SkfB family radical SAM enzyme
MFNTLLHRISADSLESMLHHFALPTYKTRIRKILSAIEERSLRERNLGAVLQTLDSAKCGFYDCFREYFDSTIVAKVLTLKVLNLCLAKHQFLARHTVSIARPFGILIDPCNGCNLACPGCVHSRSAKKLGVFDWKPGMLSAERATAFLARFGPYAIQTLFCNYGEPLLNPNTPKFIRLAKSYLSQTMLSTNLAMERFDADAYVKSGLDYMILSIDGATQPVYERYRQRGNIEIVYRNVQKLVEAKLRLGKPTPVLCWQYLAFEHNIHEISEAVDRARCLGLDEFKIASAFDVGWDDPGVQPAKIEPVTLQFNVDAGQRMIDNWDAFPDSHDAETIEREFESGWLEKLVGQPQEERGSAGHTCHWLYKSMTMDAGGKILPCCAAPGSGRDLVFSSFDTGAVKDPFNSDKYRLARLYFADKEAYLRTERRQEPYCVNCTWNQTRTDIGSAQVENYLKAAGSALFSAKSIRMLSSW